MKAIPKHCGKSGRITRPIQLSSIIWLFFIGSVIGYILEGISDFIDKGKWLHHAATVWGPFCIIYGVGAIGAYILGSLLDQKSFITQFVCCAVSGTVIEYLGSFLQEKILGSRSWDYSSQFLNINGRVSLQMTLLWGGLGTASIKWLLPLIQNSFICSRWKGERALLAVLVSLMIVDLLVTSCALLRWKGRIEGRPAGNVIERAMDEWFDNQKMSQRFFNMHFESAEKAL